MMEPPDLPDEEHADGHQPASGDAGSSPTAGGRHSDDELRPLGAADEPGAPPPSPDRGDAGVPDAPEEVTPTPGQEQPGSWPYIRAIMAADKVFAALLIIMALEALYLFAMERFFEAVVAAAILWGVLTLQRWGYALAVGLSAVFVAVMVIILVVTSLVSARAGLIGTVAFAAPIAVGVFTLLVLYTRRQHFT